MAATTLPLAYVPHSAFMPRLFVRETRFEFLRALRNKSYALSVIGFPAMFYLLFGVSNRNEFVHGQMIAKNMLAGYSAFGAVGAALFGVGVGLAFDRTSGWLELKRASPMPPFAYIAAKCAMALAFAAIIITLLCGMALGLAHVHLSLASYLRLLAVGVPGTLPFTGMGLLMAMLLPPNASPGIVNIVYLPMSFLSGLWQPIYTLPAWLQHLAPWLPTYHLAQLMLGTMGYAQPGESTGFHIVALAAWTLIFLAAAYVAFRRTDADA